MSSKNNIHNLDYIASNNKIFMKAIQLSKNKKKIKTSLKKYLSPAILKKIQILSFENKILKLNFVDPTSQFYFNTMKSQLISDMRKHDYPYLISIETKVNPSITKKDNIKLNLNTLKINPHSKGMDSISALIENRLLTKKMRNSLKKIASLCSKKT